MKKNKIYKEDYIKIFSKIHDNSIDLILIDPPYGINYNNNDWDKQNINWKTTFKECFRILKDTGNFITFSGWSTNHSFESSTENCLMLKNSIIWDRIKGKNPGKKNFVSTREDIFWFVKSDNYTFNKEDSTIKKKTSGMGKKNGSEFRRLSNVWTDISPIAPWGKEYSGYDCQKPLQLMRRLVRIFSNPGDVVLDCFCGSGSTLEAAKMECRNFIGSDNNKKAINISKKRLNL